MSQAENLSGKLLQNRQESFYAPVDENDDIPPHQLSGDESTEKSLLVSHAGSDNKANFLLTVTTIMKTVIGAGILALPFTVSKLGYAFGLLVYISVVAINQFTCYLLLRSKNLSRHSNYTTISYHIFQNRGLQAFCSLAILINNLGICIFCNKIGIVELTIFKEALHLIFHFYLPQDIAEDFYVQPWFLILILGLLEMPFCLVQKMQKLKILAFLGVAGILVFIISLVINFFDLFAQFDWEFQHELKAFPQDWLQVASVTPNIMLAMAYHMNFFPIYKGLKNSSDQKMTRASFAGLATVAFFYIIVGNIGYGLYGPYTQANFLLNLNPNYINDVLYFGMNGGFLISVYFSFPVMFFGARNNFIALCKMAMTKNKKTKIAAENYTDSVQQISSYIQHGTKEERRKKAQLHFYGYTAALYLIAIVTAILVQDVESVFNIVGAVASNAIGYILPCLFYFKVIEWKNQQKGVKFHVARVITYFFIPFGLFAIIAKYL